MSLRSSLSGARGLAVARPARGAAVALLIGTLTLGSGAGAFARFGMADDAPSPARGHAQVIAHGVDRFPAVQVAWRVVGAEAGPDADARLGQVGPGFVVARGDAVALQDVDTGRQTRIAGGEGAFAPSDATLRPVALSGDAVEYLRIDVAPAGTPAGGEDELLHAGEAFPVPSGFRDIDLVRDMLDQGEEVDLQLGSEDAPGLLFVTDGEVEVTDLTDPNAQPETVTAGEGIDISGEIAIRATGPDGATVLGGAIGPEVPQVELPTPSASPVAELGSVTVQTRVCDQGPDQDKATCIQPVGDVEFLLVIPATEFGVTGKTNADGILRFDDLGENTYALTGGVPGEFATQEALCVTADGPVETKPTESEIPGAVFELAAGADVTCTWYVYPEDLRGDVDSDGDGLLDGEEAGLGTDPNSIDTDEDGRSDGDEVNGAPTTDPLAYDTDGDGFGDNQEIVNGSDPNDPASTPDGATPSIDTDGDGLTDAQEAALGTDPAQADTDADGLTDLAEVGFEPGSGTGTDPLTADTDGDGALDGAEVDGGTDPLDPASN